MRLLAAMGVAIFYNLLNGGWLYVVGTTLIPDRHKVKFYEIVPLYPKLKYSVILYFVASILYTLISLEGYGGIFISLFCVIVASQVTRGIARFKREEIEESIEEEIERKRRQRLMG